MAGSAPCASLFWHDGKTWTALDSRRILGSLVTADTGAGASAVPRGGVLAGLGTSLQVTAGTGMAVLVGAGYCAIPHPTAGQGAYLMGVMAQAALNPATADPSHGRIDLVVARIHDLGSSGSNCTVEMVTGTPASSPVPPAVPSASLVLAQVAVPAAATAPGTITDERAWTAPPGGIILIANAAAAPAAPPSQVFYNQATGKLCRGSGTAGTVRGLTSGSPPLIEAVATSSGAEGLSPGYWNGGAAPWGIGTGIIFYYGTVDGHPAGEITQTWTADGTTDYEVAYKWQLAFPAGLWVSHTGVTAGQVTYQLSVDGAVVDTVTQFVTDTKPAPGGMASWFTSKTLGTTPARGTHTATLSVLTTATQSGYYCGVMIGDLHTSGPPVFGAASGWAAALDAESCYVTVIPVPAA